MGRPRSEPQGRITTAIRFRPHIHAALLAAADEREVSMNWLVNRLVEEGIAHLRPVESLLADLRTESEGAPNVSARNGSRVTDVSDRSGRP